MRTPKTVMLGCIGAIEIFTVSRIMWFASIGLDRDMNGLMPFQINHKARLVGASNGSVKPVSHIARKRSIGNSIDHLPRSRETF